MQPIHNKRGQLTPYGLACGYVQRWIGKPTRLRNVVLELWYEHETYHVRAHDHDTFGRLFWESFATLSAARRRYAQAKRELRENFPPSDETPPDNIWRGAETPFAANH